MQIQAVKKNLFLWPGQAQARPRLINLTENHTFLLSGPQGRKTVLRVHRPGYHTRQAIASELHWMMALRADAGMQTPRPLQGGNGEMIQTLSLSGGERRFAVLFAFEEGRQPDEEEDLEGWFEQLGRLAARCHSHACNWVPPADFSRLTWDADTILQTDAHWGDWRRAPGVSGSLARILDEAQKILHARLESYGKRRDNFGIIHADMRLANLLVHEGQVKLIDFDDCGFGWFAYDFAAAISFFEDSPRVPGLFSNWLKGYRKERALEGEDVEIMSSMVMLRRFALLAWVGSHSETDLASDQSADFARVTAELARRYVACGDLVGNGEPGTE